MAGQDRNNKMNIDKVDNIKIKKKIVLQKLKSKDKGQTGDIFARYLTYKGLTALKYKEIL